MFGILAFLGDIGCASGPVLIGLLASSQGIRLGMMIGVLFAIPLAIFLLLNYRWSQKNKVTI